MSAAIAETEHRAASPARNPHILHRVRLWLSIVITVALIGALAVYGWPYYRLDLLQRVRSPLHPVLKPSGTLGIRLGMLGLFLYGVLFLYAIRKRSKRLSRIGKSGHWIDFHVLCGIAAPLVITLHSAFKFGGLAGLAYWIMISVAISGFVGRYLYCQIPRQLNADEMSHKELEALAASLGDTLESQKLFPSGEIAALAKLPSRERVSAMPTVLVFLNVLWLDLKRPFQVRALRARVLTPAERIFTLGGLFPSRNRDLEAVITAVRRQTWLSARMLFLERAHSIFHLWHVVHRPFSYSFAVLAAVHILVVLLVGYY